jgi:hypothetical protein
MKWEKINKYYLECKSKGSYFSIAKTQVEDKFFYTLYKLPYENAEFIFRSENLEDVKAKAF